MHRVLRVRLHGTQQAMIRYGDISSINDRLLAQSEGILEETRVPER